VEDLLGTTENLITLDTKPYYGGIGMNKKKVVAGVGILFLLIAVLPQYTRCALSCNVWVDGGCGSTHRIGERMTIFFEVNNDAYIELILRYPDGSSAQLAYGTVCGGRTYYDTGEVGEPAGKRTLVLKAWSGSEYDEDTCIYYGEEGPGKIKVESTPSGAKCYLDGDYEGTTPLTIKNVSPGSHTIKLTKSGYETWKKTVTVYSDDTTYVSATLQKELGSIYVTSNPSGVKCYLDGDYQGRTPLTIKEVSQGSHKITLKEDGYYEWEDSVHVDSGETSRVSATLQAYMGSLYVDSNVDEAFVYVDGSYQGTVPVSIDVPAGSHEVEVSADKYYGYTETVTVKANETTYVDAPLEEKPGTIYVESDPSGAEVYLDGSYQGTTPEDISATSGTHELTLRYDRYYDEVRYINVYPGETTTEYISMRKVFWRSWYLGIPLAVIVLFIAAGFLYGRKQPTPPAAAPTKLKSTFESAARIARAPFVPIEMLLNIVLPEKENRCPFCDKSLEKGEILECTHCEDEGFTCKFHKECWEEHKLQQKRDKKGRVRCYKHSDIYVSPSSIKRLQPSVTS
jgi:hypothetical protein